MKIVLLSPLFSYHLSFMSVGKDPAIETFATKRAVETLDEGVLQGAARIDIYGVAVAIPAAGWRAADRVLCCPGLFHVNDTRPASLLAVGQAFLRVWVKLNMAGYGVQVMANPSLHAFQRVAGIIPEDYPESSIHTFAHGSQILSDSFGISEDEMPAWMFRIGISSELPSNWRTLRRPLTDVIVETADTQHPGSV